MPPQWKQSCSGKMEPSPIEELERIHLHKVPSVPHHGLPCDLVRRVSITTIDAGSIHNTRRGRCSFGGPNKNPRAALMFS